MKNLVCRRESIGFAVTVAVLAGCGGNLPTPYAVTQRNIEETKTPPPLNELKPCGWLSPVAKKERRLIYVADDGEILVFRERPYNPSAVGCITTPITSTHGLYVDRHGALYVTNGNNTVTVYPRGSLTPSATYSTGSAGPAYPIVDHEGDLFVSTCCNGTVLEFRPGQTTPYQTLQTPGYEADGLALDGAGNLYVAYRTSLYAGSIEEFAPGSTQGKILGMQIVQPQGLVVANDGTILLVQTGPADGIYVFPPGSQMPSLKFSVNETPVQLAITEPERKLFVSAFGWLGSGRIYQSSYPLSTSSQFHVKIVFRLRHDGHRRRHRFKIQGMALGNGQVF